MKYVVVWSILVSELIVLSLVIESSSLVVSVANDSVEVAGQSSDEPFTHTLVLDKLSISLV